MWFPVIVEEGIQKQLFRMRSIKAFWIAAQSSNIKLKALLSFLWVVPGIVLTTNASGSSHYSGLDRS